MKQNNIKVREIYIHSTHLEGVKEMEKFIKYNLKMLIIYIVLIVNKGW